jgi:triosephosphate isomerase
MRYVLANWKMHTTVDQAVALFGAIQQGLCERADGDTALPLSIICPPFVSLAPLYAMADPRLVALGAQNCHWEQEGPYTGEVSPAMLKGLVDYVLLGHSERRAGGDTDELVARKVAAAAACGLVPVIFVGEDRPDDEPIACTVKRLHHAVSRIDLTTQPILVVYEPSWAIGAEDPANVEHVGGVVAALKARLRDLGAPSPEVLYGGTVSDGNIHEFTAVGVLDGVGATRAALTAEGFLALVDHVAMRGDTDTGPLQG